MTAHSSTVVEQNVAVQFAVAITKAGVNADRRTVRGLMTQEIVDRHGEEIDFDSVVACLGSWTGNLREMHQPLAVGRAIDIVIREDIKAVEVEAYISTGAESTWQKAKDGTLGFYSIGGIGDRVFGTRSDGSRGPRILMTRINELSLVDSGACPTCTIAVAKLVDGQPLAQLAARPTVISMSIADAQAAVEKAVAVARARFETKLAEQKATFAGTIARLEAQVSKLAASPIGGGPAANAKLPPGTVMVDKVLGGCQHSEGAEVSDARVIEDLIAAAQGSADEGVRKAIAQQIIRIQHRTGLGAVMVPHV